MAGVGSAGGDTAASPKLGAYLTPLAVIALSFGYAVGWGSFVMPGTVFLPGAGPAGTAIGILLGAAVIAVFAFNYHRMLLRVSGPGGAVAFTTRAFGSDHGFLLAWFLWLTYVAILWANATALVLLVRYLFGDALQFGFATAISSTSGTTNAYNAADFQDAHLPLPDSIDEFSPSLMNRIRNYIQELIKPKTTMPENNTNPTNTAQPTAEQQIQTLTAERDQALTERDQAITERDQARTERDQAVADRDSLQAIIDQTPTVPTAVNGDDKPAPEDPVSDFISNSPAYQAIKEELYN